MKLFDWLTRILRASKHIISKKSGKHYVVVILVIVRIPWNKRILTLIEYYKMSFIGVHKHFENK